MPRPALFRLQRSEQPNGTYWTAIKGKVDPIRIGLGVLDAQTAGRCLVALLDEDARGNTHRLVDLAKQPQFTVRGREVPGRELLVAHLLSGTGELLNAVLGPPEPEYAKMTIAEYYASVYETSRKVSNPRAWRTEAHDWTRIVASSLGRTRMSNVDRAGLHVYFEGLRKLDGTPASWNMKRKHKNALRSLFALALDRGDLKGTMPEFPRQHGSMERALAEPEPLTPTEVVRLIEAAPSAMHRALFAMCFVLGMRPSEAVSMRWEDIDWEFTPRGGVYKGRIAVRGPADKDGKRQTKTRESRAHVPMLALGGTELVAHWISAGKPTAGPVFTRAGGKPYATGKSKTTFKTALKSAAARAGLADIDGEPRRIFPYLGRHTAGTSMIESGVPIDTVAKMLRHTNPQMLRRHYDHTGALNAPGLDRAPRYGLDDDKS